MTPPRSTGDYRHDEKRRKNNPPVGMVAYEVKAAEQPLAHYGYDPHLSPQLVWAGKPGLVNTEVEDAAGLAVDTVSLHIHKRISTQAIIHAVQRPQAVQLDLFADPRQPLKEAVEFYQHDVDWANRLILGDSLLVMNSLVQRELLAGQVQMIYIDPPYGVKFSSNFQPRIDQPSVREGDDDLTREPEQIKAYRDTWTLGIHSYLTYLRDRLRVARELLADSGSILDPTCGSGTTAYVAEQWGRRWITCDTSRVAVSLARQRLLTATYPYFTLAAPVRGVDGGFRYRTVPHITLRSIAQNTRLDPVVARYQPLLDEALAGLNQAAGQAWQPWEVPVEPAKGWSQDTRDRHARYRDLRRRKQAEIDRIIAEDAPQETLYDQPQIDTKIVRVAGPFTVEAIPPAELASGDADSASQGTEIASPDANSSPPDRDGISVPAPNEAGVAGDAWRWNGDAISALLIELMRQDGITFPDNRRMQFDSLTPLTGGVLHAEGTAAGQAQRVAVSFGPQHGAVTARQVEDGLWEAVRGGYDLLVFAGFAFDGAALSAIETGHPRLRTIFSHIRPDVLLTDARGASLLKTTASAQLFTVFGEPDVVVRRREDGTFEVELLGVDVYDPLTGEVHSARASQVAAWFLDTDYDRRTFHICQAFFPNKSAWDRLARALKGTLNDDLFDQLTGRVSLPFTPGDHRRIAVKVIDQRGNEVMRVVGM